ncbi:hypothetical protein F8388_013199 [Cannabis sativa]|uniref:BHLH domain-containing protein n=1 Tax=Cannabis sativa TaxID=3483 RepID=A0A7J6DYB4_CANSA|nr:hypothetical protein F8388_013199 [Cannabis sativa]
MGEAENSSVLRRTLKNLCVSNGWSYGVFWCFDQRNPMLLSLEDAYFEDQVGAVIENMLLKIHMLGEGIIGQTALNGKYQWIQANEEWNSFRSTQNNNFFQDDSEVCYEFSSGIKTIVVVPVESRGVLHFGSVEMISESLDFVNETMRVFQETENVDVFNTLENAHCYEKVDNFDINGLFASLFSSQNSSSEFIPPIFGENNCSVSDMDCEKMSFFNKKNATFLDDHDLFCTEYPTLASSNQDSFVSQQQQQQQQQFLCSGKAKSLESFPEKLFEEFEPMDFRTDLLGQLDDLSQWFASSSSPDLNGDKAIQQIPAESTQSYVKSGIIQGDENEIMMPSSASGNCISGLKSYPRKGLFSELGIEQLLVGSNSSSTCLTKSNLEDESFSSPIKRRKIQNTTKEVPKSQVGLWIDDSYSIIGGSSSSTVLSQSQMASEEPKKVIRKRARPGESTRPRPKDRQLIQDRIKELRGIIPSGGKCSIDSLLDRTIKYMLFLQGVTKYADKLKQSNKPKLINNDNGAILRDNNNNISSTSGGGGGGVTWAFEVGGQSMACPIIVEDLNPPGQMLIEMLCEEHGLFLEIADMIRGFGLSILKGVMEVRENNKIWAHFIVEASNHITRIDVFWSLVQLLQQTNAANEIDSTKLPSNVVMNGGIPLFDNYQKPNFPPPICLTETLH